MSNFALIKYHNNYVLVTVEPGVQVFENNFPLKYS